MRRLSVTATLLLGVVVFSCSYSRATQASTTTCGHGATPSPHAGPVSEDGCMCGDGFDSDQCPAGYMSNRSLCNTRASQWGCLPCPFGEYSPDKHMARCYTCPTGMTTMKTGSVSSLDCVCTGVYGPDFNPVHGEPNTEFLDLLYAKRGITTRVHDFSRYTCSVDNVCTVPDLSGTSEDAVVESRPVDSSHDATIRADRPYPPTPRGVDSTTHLQCSSGGGVVRTCLPGKSQGKGLYGYGEYTVKMSDIYSSCGTNGNMACDDEGVVIGVTGTNHPLRGPEGNTPVVFIVLRMRNLSCLGTLGVG